MTRRTRTVNVLLLIPMFVLGLLLVVLVRQRQSYFIGWVPGCIFYGLPVAIVFMLASSFWMSVIRRAQIALAIWTIGIALVICEASVQFLAPAWTVSGFHLRKLVSEKLGRPFDARTKRQVVEDYRSAGKLAVPVLPVAFFFVHPNQPLKLSGRSIMPLSGISKSLTVYDNEGGEYLVYQSDEYGFTNPAGMFEREPCDVVVVGDSFAHGACVPVGRDSVSLIRREFPATINLGYMASGPLSYLGTLTEYALPRHPRVVLWYHFEGNDFQDLFKERQTLLRRYLEEDFRQGLAELQPAIDEQLQALTEKELRLADSNERTQYLLWRIATLQGLRTRLLSFLRQKDLRWTASLEDFELVVAKAKERVQKGGGELKLVYLPSFERYCDKSQVFRQQEQKVLETMARLNVPVINIATEFERNADPLSFFPLRLNGHYNEEGYALVAQTILDDLKRIDDLVPVQEFRVSRVMSGQHGARHR